MMRILMIVLLFAALPGIALAQEQESSREQQETGEETGLPSQPPVDGRAMLIKPQENRPDGPGTPGGPDEETNYTLGPDDVIDISVARHAEFSGIFPVNQEGKIQYKFIGDIDVNGYTKKDLEARIRNIISGYVVEPQVDVTIVDFRSKVIYVIGEVGLPGKYYMRSESIPVREAIMQAGLPTIGAAMRKCRLITPGPPGKVRTKRVNIYSVLYGGNLRHNIEMKPGDVLYVPSTVMAKVFRVIAPITAPIISVGNAQGGFNTLNTKSNNVNQRVRY